MYCLFLNCHGICYRNEADKVHTTPPRDLYENLDTLVFPDRLFQKNFSYNIVGSRGCHGRCTFCDARVIFRSQYGVRVRSIDNILDEIEYLVEKYEAKRFNFLDSTFCGGDFKADSRMLELYDGICKRKVSINFHINLRSDQMTNDTIKLLLKLRDVGLGNILVGLEAGNEHDLSLYGKRTTVATNERALYNLNEAGIINGSAGVLFDYGFINFNPYTSKERLESNMDFLVKNELDVFPFIVASRLMITSGSSLSKKIIKDGLFDYNYDVPITEPYRYSFLYESMASYSKLTDYFRDGVNLKYFRDIPTLCYFLGSDQIAIDLYKTYREYTNYITSKTLSVFRLIIDNNYANQWCLDGLIALFNTDVNNYINKLTRLYNIAIIHVKRKNSTHLF